MPLSIGSMTFHSGKFKNFAVDKLPIVYKVNQMARQYTTITEPINVNYGETLIINNSLLDFRELSGQEPLITNHGNLTIINSTILSNMRIDHASMIVSDGNLSIINSTIINKHLLIDFENKHVTYITAISLRGGQFSLVGTYFENYTTAVSSESTVVKQLKNNYLKNCSIGFNLRDIKNTLIVNNTFINSIGEGIGGDGYNVTIINNFIYNKRGLLQGESTESGTADMELFNEVTIGIGFNGNRTKYINNSIINTFKSFFLYKVNHVLIENNSIYTIGRREGELQLQSGEYLIIRNNKLVNQWDPIEIYNSRHIFIDGNYIKDASSGIRVEKVDYLRDIVQENITVMHNILINAPYNGISEGNDVCICYNLFNNSDQYVDTGSKNVLIYGNVFNGGRLIIRDSRDIVVSNNRIASFDISFINFNNMNLTLINNTIIWLGVITVPDQLAEISSLYLLVAIIIVIVTLLVFVVRKVRRWRRTGKNQKD